MIVLTYSTAFMLYLSLSLIVVFGFWCFNHYQTKKKVIISNEQGLYLCEYCHHTYLEDTLRKVNTCPQCGLLNRQNSYEPLKDKTKL